MQLGQVPAKSLGLITGVMLVLMLLGAAEGLAMQPTRAGHHLSDYTAGVQAYHAGRYDTAVRCLRRVLAQNGANTHAHYYLALSLDSMGLASEAATEYARVAQDRKPGSDSAIVAYAKNRLQVLRPVASSGNSGNMTLMATGNTISPAVYHGSISQVAIPLKNSKNALMVDAVLTQGDTHTGGAFIIDTGATYTSISQEMAQSLGLDLDRADTVYITTANGRIEVPKVTLESLNVSGMEAHNIEATVIPVRKGSSFSGLLGLSFIRQFVVTIDPGANQLIFRKN